MMEKQPKISVITPCFNHGKYIMEMIASVLNQTFQDFEIVIVNDGSTDDTAAVLQSIDHPKIRIINTWNNGPAKARNIAIENACAPIIMNLDSDDKISPCLLGKAFEAFSSNPDAGIVYSDAENFGAQTGKFEISTFSMENMLFDNRIISQAFFKKADWLIVGGYSDKLIYGAEDWDFWLSILELERQVVHIPEMLVQYRRYDNLEDCRSGKRKKSSRKMAESLVIIFNRHKKLYNSYPKAFKYFSGIERELNNGVFYLRFLKNAAMNLFNK